MRWRQASVRSAPLPQDPVFIVGYPRSGTTLLQRFLVMQPGFHSLPETHYFSVIERRLHLGEKEQIAPSELDVLLQAVVEKMETRLAEGEIRLLAMAAERCRLTSKMAFEFLVSRLLTPAPPRRKLFLGASWRWIEKTPSHANFLRRVLLLYPRAQVIHVLRHPVPAILSRRRKFPFNRETPLERMAAAWHQMMGNVELSRRQFPGRILSLRYEDLVADADTGLRAVEAFLHAAFGPGRLCLAGRSEADERLILPSETWKLGDQTDEIVNTNDQYRSQADPADIERIESVVGERMREYGYNRFAGPCPVESR